MEPIIKLTGVYKIYRVGDERVRALNGVDIEIMPGEFCCIVGRSGSGKSTMLNMLAGLEKPTRGTIVIAGKHLEKLNESELVEFRLRNVGFVFQAYNLFPTHTALENVAMPLVYRGVSRRKRLVRARKMIKAVGLESHANHTPTQMSGGQQQRVGIARALVSRPKIIFADEPTGNLDVRTSANILKMMTDISHESGTTLIIVTHDPEMAQYADRVIQLLDGKVLEMRVNEHPAPIEELPPDTDQQPTLAVLPGAGALESSRSGAEQAVAANSANTGAAVPAHDASETDSPASAEDRRATTSSAKQQTGNAAPPTTTGPTTDAAEHTPHKLAEPALPPQLDARTAVVQTTASPAPAIPRASTSTAQASAPPRRHFGLFGGRRRD